MLITRPVAALLLCAFVQVALGQNQSSDRALPQSGTAVAPIRVESKLVVVRVMVANKRVWRNGPSDSGQRCALATKEALARLPATEPYIPPDCEGLYIRGLTAKDFHIFVDGVEQRIQSVTSESKELRVRDNQGVHSEFSQTPVGRWSTTDGRIPHYFLADYGFLARNRYDLSFAPNTSDPGGCHQIRVKVDRRNSIVAASDEYCASESPSDILNGSALGKRLEGDLASGQPGKIPLSLQAAVLESDKGKGCVRIALEFPLDSLHWRWRQDWTLDATIGLLGMIYRPDGTLVSRFSDFACCTPYSMGLVFGMRGTTVNGFTDLGKQFGIPSDLLVSMTENNVEKGTLPTRYETQLDLPPGGYDLRIILSDGERFGRAEAHLNIETYDGKGLAVSSVILCKRFRDAHVAAVEAAAANFAPQYVPMVSDGIQVTLAGRPDFKNGELLIPYFEIYAPQAVGPTAQIQVHLRIVDAPNGDIVKDFPPVDAAPYIRPGSTIIPIAREVPIATLPKGEYRLEVQASDSTGRSTPWRAANFTITDKK